VGLESTSPVPQRRPSLQPRSPSDRGVENLLLPSRDDGLHLVRQGSFKSWPHLELLNRPAPLINGNRFPIDKSVTTWYILLCRSTYSNRISEIARWPIPYPHHFQSLAHSQIWNICSLLIPRRLRTLQKKQGVSPYVPFRTECTKRRQVKVDSPPVSVALFNRIGSFSGRSLWIPPMWGRADVRHVDCDAAGHGK